MNKVFCPKCTYYRGGERDLPFHNKMTHGRKGIPQSDYKFRAHQRDEGCLYQCMETTRFFIFTFKSYFGRDIVTKIARLVYKTRVNLQLWCIHSTPRTRVPNKFDRKNYEIKMMLQKKDY